MKAGRASMNSSTANTKRNGFPKPHMNASGDPVENEANRRKATTEAALAVEGLNRLREQKLQQKAK
jgi:hypothetical protein